ncbi:acyltransferase [Hymenobacter sp. DG01]|uniref:acyltransferase family protein n=1 Tax=Hymenobacter sp. DG01 TaxID=2584940 RepID=UPI00111F751D|nr:acyltransferase [Hymenobacter sp. DG01]
MSTTATRPFFPNLDGLRTLACAGVFLYHTLFMYAFLWTPHEAPVYHYGLRLLSLGTMGVNFFFVLSGFLITYLLLHEEAYQGHINLLGFYWRRVLRIWPVYFACLAFGFWVVPWWMHAAGQPWHDTARPELYLTFLANLDMVDPKAFSLGVLWSVAVEEQFYALWPLLLLLFTRWRPGAVILVLLASLLFRYAHATDPVVLYQHTLAVVSDMALGGGAAWLAFSRPGFQAWVSRWPRSIIVVGYLAGLGLLVGQKYFADSTLGITFQRLLRGLFFVFVVLEQNYATRSWFKAGQSRSLTYWGRFTYGFYCLHPVSIFVVLFCFDRLHLPHTLPTVLALTALCLPFSLALAWLSYRYWEQPFLRLKYRYAAEPEPAPSL